MTLWTGGRVSAAMVLSERVPSGAPDETQENDPSHFWRDNVGPGPRFHAGTRNIALLASLGEIADDRAPGVSAFDRALGDAGSGAGGALQPVCRLHRRDGGRG